MSPKSVYAHTCILPEYLDCRPRLWRIRRYKLMLKGSAPQQDSRHETTEELEKGEQRAYRGFAAFRSRLALFLATANGKLIAKEALSHYLCSGPHLAHLAVPDGSGSVSSQLLQGHSSPWYRMRCVKTEDVEGRLHFLTKGNVILQNCPLVLSFCLTM